MYKQTIWYELYSGRKIKWDSFEKYFGKNGNDDTWYIYYIEEDIEPRFELHAHIEGDTVISAEPFKAEVYGGHGRPTIDEKSLTSSEKKYAVSIFDECFPDRVGDLLDGIIEKAMSSQVEYGGYNIFKSGSDAIVFKSPEGKNVKLSYKNLIKAIDYSHIDVAILRDADVIKEFAGCFGIKNYELLAAILLSIDPTDYPEYAELERKYRYSKMEEAIIEGNIELCEKYIDVLTNPKNNVQIICENAVSQNNESLLRWLIEHIPVGNCDLTIILGAAVKRDKTDLFYYLLDSGMVDAARSDSTKWNSPMYIAAYDKGNEKYVIPLLQHGFALPAKIGYRYFNDLSFAELKSLLKYNVEFDLNTVSRIYTEKCEELITAIEKRPLRYCCEGMLLHAALKTQNFVLFSEIIQTGDLISLANEVVASGFRASATEWFEMAYSNSPEWASALIETGFNINYDDSKLLHNACKDLNVEFAIYLLSHGANPKLKSQYSETIFEKAAGFHGYLTAEQQREKERLCKYLLDFGLNPVKESRKAPSILTYLLGKTEEFDFVLADWLADHNRINLPDLPEECKDTKHLPIAHILDEFSRHYSPNVLRYFINKGAKTNAEGITEDRLFLNACVLCDLPDLQLVVAAGANINETDRYYATNGLYAAVRANRPYEVVKYLVEIGLDVNCVRDAFRNTHGTTKVDNMTSVLDIAEEKCSSEVVEYLKAKGALHASELR